MRITELLSELLAPETDTAQAGLAERRLLEKINEGPDQAAWARYHHLLGKQRAETLTGAEHEELIALIDEVELANARRLEHLSALARLRGTTLRGIMQQLGLDRPPYA